MAIDESRTDRGATDRAPLLHVAGTLRTSYFCSGCGYGIAVRGHLPTCPMCGGDAWQPETPTRSAARRWNRND
ncbi:MAG TPA: hypothetical protein VNT58_00175 [Gaiellaceae bacterium]|nr:hypothetical protein [Gaiellaceae bacterium]